MKINLITLRIIVESSLRNYLSKFIGDIEKEFLFYLGILENRITETCFGSFNHNFTQNEKA